MKSLMQITRRGKIARLPQPLREELNYRLDSGAPASELLPWLNALPEVQALLDAQFGGRPISPQNLSQWRQGGWQDWLLRQSELALTVQLTQEALGQKPVQEEPQPPFIDVLTHWLMGRYTLATRLVAQTDGPKGWRLLHQMCADVAKLQRGEWRTRRLALNHAELKFAQTRAAQNQQSRPQSTRHHPISEPE